MASNFESSRENKEEVRIVLVGKTGNGKSATGNTILGQQDFESKFSGMSITVDCTKRKAEVDGQQVAVIDTPGVFDTRYGMDRTTKDISQCIVYAAPGPHVFLVVIRLGRYTEEEKLTVQRIQEIFGQAADKHSMVLFTHGDLLEDTTIEDFLAGCPDLQELVDRCNGQYHVFNNKLKDRRSQVTELLQKIRNLVQKNGGSHYTNEMFQEVERAIEEEKQRILKEKEEQIHKEKEQIEITLKNKYDKEMKKMLEQIQAERERDRKEREEEKKEREEERKREREKWWEMEKERVRERQETEQERKREREEWWEKEMEKERGMERERKERTDERKMEREEREAERKRGEQQTERIIEIMRKEREEERRKEVEKLQSRHESEAREKAEKSNPLYPVVKVCGHVCQTGKKIILAIGSWF